MSTVSSERIAVTVLTGFLGSGKTTLVNHILTAQHGHRIAVVENEFGEIPIDNDIVLRSEEDIFELTNGCCLCCTGRTDLIDILRKLLERRERFDRIIIETTGLADPNPIAQTFFVDEDMAAHFKLDAIVTLVDAKHIEAHLDEIRDDGVGSQAADQLAFADRLVVNKVDLVNNDVVGQVRQRIRELNATAEIITSSYSVVDLDQIFGISAFDAARTMSEDPHWLDDSNHVHDPSLQSESIEINGRIDRTGFERWLAEFVNDHGDELYRMKGIIGFDGEDRRFVLQGVHHIYDVSPAEPPTTAPHASTLVFIGRGLDRGDVVESLKRCHRYAAEPADTVG